MTTDTFFQLDQALGREPFNDWHPVVMSLVWKWLIAATGEIGSMAALQVGFAWLASVLTCYYILKTTRNRCLSLLGFLILVLPNSANIVGAVWKDTHMALAMYLAVVCILVFRLRGRFQWVFLGMAILALLYATLVRKNAAVGVVPLLFLVTTVLLVNRSSFSVKKAVAVFAVAIAVFGGVVLVIGKSINVATGATSNSQVTQIMLDDLIFAVPQSAIESSETAPPALKSKIADARQECEDVGAFWDAYWKCYGRGASGEAFTEIAHPDAVKSLWIEQVPRNFPRYLDYRAMTTAKFLFTSNLQFASTEEKEDLGVSQYAPKLNDALRSYVVDLGLKQLPWLFHGWFWLALGVAGVVASVRGSRPSITATAIFIAGLLYLVSFFPTAPASDYRYIYWSALSVVIGLITLVAERTSARRRTPVKNSRTDP